jgi:hypothetical protein
MASNKRNEQDPPQPEVDSWKKFKGPVHKEDKNGCNVCWGPICKNSKVVLKFEKPKEEPPTSDRLEDQSKQATIRELICNLNIETLKETVVIADHCDLDEVMTACQEFIVENWVDVFFDNKLKGLIEDNPRLWEKLKEGILKTIQNMYDY